MVGQDEDSLQPTRGRDGRDKNKTVCSQACMVQEAKEGKYFIGLVHSLTLQSVSGK